MNIKQPISRCIEDGCTGALYDNRPDKATGKRSKKSPDFKCKDDGDHVYWIDTKKGVDVPEDAIAQAKPAASSEAGPGKPGGGGNGKREWIPPPDYTWAELALAYQKCHTIAARTLGPTALGGDVVAATATIFIAATKIGLKTTPKAQAPNPAPPPTPTTSNGRHGEEPALHRHPGPQVTAGRSQGIEPEAAAWQAATRKADRLPEDLPEEEPDDDLPF